MEAESKKCDDTQGIIIPKPILEVMGIEELFEGYESDYRGQELDWGPPAGNEVW